VHLPPTLVLFTVTPPRRASKTGTRSYPSGLHVLLGVGFGGLARAKKQIAIGVLGAGGAAAGALWRTWLGQTREWHFCTRLLAEKASDRLATSIACLVTAGVGGGADCGWRGA